MIQLSLSFFDRIRMDGHPAAHPDSMVVCGQARFTILTDRLIRLEWSATGHFEDKGTFAFPNRYAEPVAFSCNIHDGQLDIQTGVLSLYYVDDGHPFSSANLSIHFDLAGQRVRWTPGMINTGNLRGTRRTLDQCAGVASLQEGLLSRDGWSLFDDSGTTVWSADQRWVEARSEDHIQDWYFFGYGHDYKAALREYTRFGGPIPLIPRYVLGAWWSRFWAYHADDLIQLVEDFNAHDIPLDVLVIDMDWHTPVTWTGYTWNRELFPDPEAFLAQVHARGLYATLNLHPAQGVQKHEAIYPRFAELMGRDPATGDAIKFNCADPNFVQHYFEQLHHPMEAQGVDFWWLDWQQGESTAIRNLDPLPWLNHLHFRDSTRRGTRPMLYSRWGGLGNHRYPIGFSGDSHATWESLRFQPYFTATAANVGYGWWSHDIGGHFGATDPELYARWVQFGAVSPCLRLHSTKDPLAERRPWAFPAEVYEAAKAAIQLRYRLLPYLYSAARSASLQGLSLCCPMYYEYPDSEDAYLARDQYFLGDQLFVAPIVRPADPQTGLAPVDVWIPDGTWIEFTTLEVFTGPRWVRLYGDLKRIPMFARAGAIIPMAPPLMRTRDLDGSALELVIFPGADGQFTLYEDDGTTEGYQRGDYETTVIQAMRHEDGRLVIAVAGAVDESEGESQYVALPPRRTLDLRVKGSRAPDQVRVNGSEYSGWRCDPGKGETVITLKDTDRRVPVNVQVKTERTPEKIVDSMAVEAPFVHVIEYETFEDTRQQLGTLIIVPPGDGSPFDMEVMWRLQRGSVLTSKPLMRTHCNTRQIIQCPFADDSSLNSARWSVSVTIRWQGQSLHYYYGSQNAYPSINRWQTLIDSAAPEPLTLSCITLADGSLNPALPWSIQTPDDMQNVTQPFGLILLEHERQRILDGEPLQACASASVASPFAQDAVLCVQCAGEHTAYLNGQALNAAAPIQHAKLSPMFPTWMPPTFTYYAVTLQPGTNQLVLFTHPTAKADWWGIGATLFDPSGDVLTGVMFTDPTGESS